jgi:NAD(P)-dependent dehydrogenase (short-subunit alcohol dehydrogenase family)
MQLLRGKVAVVTGGGSGIGEATARLFADEGAQVVVADVRPDAAEATATAITRSGGTALAVRVDVTQARDVEAMIRTAVQTYGGLDVLLNSADMDIQGEAGELSEDAWDRVVALNLTGVFLGCKYAIPAMRERGGGSIINTTSIMGMIGGSLGAVHLATRGGVVLLTKSAALDYARYNIRVNCICPGHIETPLLQRLLDADPDRRARLLYHSPMGRLGRPHEIAQGVLFLASDEASFVTGSTLVIDGGYTVR